MAEISHRAIVTMIGGVDVRRIGDVHYGMILFVPEVGGRVIMQRNTKNGRDAPGNWVTSKIISVKKVTENTVIFQTENSEYELSVQPRDNSVERGSTTWSPESTVQD